MLHFWITVFIASLFIYYKINLEKKRGIALQYKPMLLKL
jgi:hypothetical protein